MLCTARRILPIMRLCPKITVAKGNSRLIAILQESTLSV